MFKLDAHTQEVVFKSAASITVKSLGMLATMVFSIVLGRTLGAEGVGIINLSNRIVSLLLVLVLCGLPTAIMKLVSIAYSKQNWQTIVNVMHTARVISGLLSFFCLILGLLLVDWLCFSVFNEPNLRLPLMIGLVAMIPQTFSRIYAPGLEGFKKMWQASLVDNTLSACFVLIAILTMWVLQIKITVVSVSLIYAISRLVVAVTIGSYWRKLTGVRMKEIKPRLEIGKMLKISMPFFVNSALAVIAWNVDAIMIGWLSDAKQVGLYVAAINLALLTGFFSQVSNVVINPKIAVLFAEGKIQELELMVQRITYGLTIIASVSLFLFLIFGRFILSLWGTEFESAYFILVILCCGQFFNVATGCVGSLLSMCGHEKLEARLSTTILISNIILNYFLITHFGATGAAFATTFTLSAGMLVRLIAVRRKLNISIWSGFKKT